MLAMNLHSVPPAGDATEVYKRVFAARSALSDQDTGKDQDSCTAGTPIITEATDPNARQTTIEGPPGFSLSLHQLAPHQAFSPAPQSARITAAIVVRGELRGTGGRVWGPRSLQLLDRGETAVWTAGPDATEVLLLTFVPRTGRALAAGARSVQASDLTPLRSRLPFRWVPQGIGDFLSPRDLYLALGPTNKGPLGFRVAGPDELVVVFVQTPKGTGPALHVHTKSTEMFCVLEGRFRITWGDHGEHEQILERLDTIVIPKGHNRAFEALSEGENWILPMVVGTNDEAEDILWLEHVFEPVRAQLPFLAAIASRLKLQVGQRAG